MLGAILEHALAMFNCCKSEPNSFTSDVDLSSDISMDRQGSVASSNGSEDAESANLPPPPYVRTVSKDSRNSSKKRLARRGQRSAKPELAEMLVVSIRSRPAGKDVGIEFEHAVGGLLVRQVVPGGLVDEWNRVNQLDSIKPHDVIYEVNGVSGNYSEMLALLSSATDLTLRGSRRVVLEQPVRFQAKITKPDKLSQLAVDLVCKSPTAGLLVSAVGKGGLIDEWNKAHPLDAILPKDAICKVNDESGNFVNMLDVVAKADELILEIRREPAVIGVAINKSSVCQELGLDLLQKGKELMVMAIKAGGLIEAWNLERPAEAVKPRDAIYQVNSTSGGSDKMLEILRSSRDVQLKIKRQGGPAETADVHPDEREQFAAYTSI